MSFDLFPIGPASHPTLGFSAQLGLGITTGGNATVHVSTTVFGWQQRIGAVDLMVAPRASAAIRFTGQTDHVDWGVGPQMTLRFHGASNPVLRRTAVNAFVGLGSRDGSVAPVGGGGISYVLVPNQQHRITEGLYVGVEVLAGGDVSTALTLGWGFDLLSLTGPRDGDTSPR